jgi:hypothetical protein
MPISATPRSTDPLCAETIETNRRGSRNRPETGHG